MAAELLGTVYVRVKAITDQLADDIRDGAERGSKSAEADLQRAGGDSGDAFGEGFGDSVEASIPQGVKRGVKRAGDDGDVDRETNLLGRKLSSKITKAFDGDKLASSLSSAFQSIKVPNIVGLALFGAGPLIQAAIAAVLPLVAVLGVALQGLAATGAAAAGLFAAIIPAAGLLVLAFKQATPELEAFKKEAKELLEPWKTVGEITQRGVLPGLSAALRNFQRLINPMSAFGERVGIIAGDTARLASEALTSDTALRQWSKGLGGAEKVFKNLGDSVVLFADSIPSLFAGLMPLAEDLSGIIEGLVEKFNAKVTGDDFYFTLDKWWERAKLVGGALSDVFWGLWNILSIGGDAASEGPGSMLQGIADAAQSFRDWTVEGAGGIRGAFDEAMPIARELWGLLTDIGEIVFTNLTAGDTSGLQGFIATARDELVPALDNIVTAVRDSGLAAALLDLFDAIAEAVNVASGSELLPVVLTAVADGITALADAFRDPIAQEIATYLLPVGVALAAINAVPGGGAVLGLAAKGIGALVTALGGAGGSLLSGLAGMFSGIGAALGPLMPILSGIAGPVALIAAAGAAAYLVFRNWDTISEFVPRALQAVLRAFGELPGMLLEEAPKILEAAMSWIGDMAPKVGPALGRFIGTFMGFMFSLPFRLIGLGFRLIGVIFDEIPRWLVTEGPGVLAGIAELFVTFITNLPSTLSGVFSGVVGFVAEGIRGFAGQFGEGIGQFITDVATYFAELPSRVMEVISAFGTMIGEFIISTGPTVISHLAQWWESLSAWFAGLPERAVSALVNFAADVGGFFLGTAASVMSQLDLWWEELAEWFGGLPDRAVDALVNFVEVVGSFFVGTATDMIAQLDEWWDELAGWFEGIPDLIDAALEGVRSRFLDIGESIVNWIIDGIESLGGSLLDAVLGLVPGPARGAITTIWGAVNGRSAVAPASAFLGPTPAAFSALAAPPAGRTLGVSATSGTAAPGAVGSYGSPGTGARRASSFGTGALFNIENATFSTPQDADMVAARVRSAIKLVTA